MVFKPQSLPPFLVGPCLGVGNSWSTPILLTTIVATSSWRWLNLIVAPGCWGVTTETAPKATSDTSTTVVAFQLRPRLVAIRMRGTYTKFDNSKTNLQRPQYHCQNMKHAIIQGTTQIHIFKLPRLTKDLAESDLHKVGITVCQTENTPRVNGE